MTSSAPSTDDDFDFPDEDDRRTAARRMFTYSTQAIVAGSATDKVLVNHPDFKSSLQACDRVFQLGRELGLQQGVVVVGPPGVGKTALIRYFRNSLPSSSMYEEGAGAIVIRLRARPTVGYLIGSMLRQMKYPFPQVNQHTLAIKRDVLLEALRQKGARLLLIDEGHHLKSQTKIRNRTSDGSTVTDLINELMDEVPMGLHLTGTEGLLDLGEIDPHLESRVTARFQLRDFACGAHWYGFLRAFKRHCNFDLSLIETKEEGDRLHKATGGNLRAFKRLITEAVLVAYDEHRAAVTHDDLKLAFARVNGDAHRAGGLYGE
jgi:hypothetical protein